MSIDIRGAAPPANPYVGPRALETGELLFGRDDEVVDLLNQLIADRVVLLYAVSGAGKTSLIRAGLLPGLESRGFAPLPVVQVRDEPPAGAPNRYLLSVLQRLEAARPEGDRLTSDALVGLTLGKYLRDRLPKAPGGRVLVFDQFEDVLRIDPTDTAVKDAFFKDVGAALREAGVWAVFSMREEYVPGLDPYLRHLPTRLASRFRLALLAEAAAKEAMCGPADAAGVPFRPAVADDLVKQLLLVQVQQLDGRVVTKPGPSVEPVQLQVVCQLLWERKPPAATEIGPDALAGFSVDQALEQYYAGKVATAARAAGVGESRVRRWVEDKLITAQRLRGQVLKGPAETEKLPNAAIDGLVGAYLVRAEQRLGGIWFELTHDRLVDPIRRNNRAWFASRLQPFQLQADQWAARAEGKKGALLLGGVALADAEEWAAAHPGEVREIDKAFLEQSRGARTTRDRIRTGIYRWWAALSTLALLVGLGLLVWAFDERNKAADAAERATSAAKDAEAERVRADAEREKAKSEAKRAGEESVRANTQEKLAKQHGDDLKQSLTYQTEFLIKVLTQIASRGSRLSAATDAGQVRDAATAWAQLYSLLKGTPTVVRLTDPDLPAELKAIVDYLNKVEAGGAFDRAEQERLTLGIARHLRKLLLADESTTARAILTGLRARYYAQATGLAKRIAASDDHKSAETEKQVRQFWSLYYGALAVVEGDDVSIAMSNFGRELKQKNWAGLPALAEALKGVCETEPKP